MIKCSFLLLANSTAGHILPAGRVGKILDSIGINFVIKEQAPVDYAKYDALIDFGYIRHEVTLTAIKYFSKLGKYIIHFQNPSLHESEIELYNKASIKWSTFKCENTIHVGHLLPNLPERIYASQVNDILYLGTGQAMSFIDYPILAYLRSQRDINVTYVTRNKPTALYGDNITYVNFIEDVYSEMNSHDLIIGGCGSGLVNESLHFKQPMILYPALGMKHELDLANVHNDNGGVSFNKFRPNELDEFIRHHFKNNSFQEQVDVNDVSKHVIIDSILSLIK